MSVDKKTPTRTKDIFKTSLSFPEALALYTTKSQGLILQRNLMLEDFRLNPFVVFSAARTYVSCFECANICSTTTRRKWSRELCSETRGKKFSRKFPPTKKLNCLSFHPTFANFAQFNRKNFRLCCVLPASDVDEQKNWFLRLSLSLSHGATEAICKLSPAADKATVPKWSKSAEKKKLVLTLRSFRCKKLFTPSDL